MATFLTGQQWADAQGRTKLTIPRTSTSFVSPLQVAMLAKSNASIISDWTGPEVVHSPTPTPAPFISVLDQANLYFQTAGGDVVLLALPAPLQSIFMPDTITVDPTTIPAVIAQALLVLTDAGGNPVVSYVNGIRVIRS